MRLSRWTYYGRSIPLMLAGITNWSSIPIALATRRGRLLRLKDLQFFYRDAMDVWTIKETCLDDHYRLGAAAIRPQGLVIDIGAGIGDFAIMAARRHPQARVLAFEPFPESAALLRRNLQLNQVDQVHLFAEAVGASDGYASLDTSSRSSVQHNTVRVAAGDGTMAVTRRSLAEIIDRYAIDRCDLLKLDCEGAEFEILLSLDQALLARIDRISLEYHDRATSYAHPALINLLEQAGFCCERVANPVHDDLGFLYATR